MLKKYRIEKPLDDYVILNNLDVFKAQIVAQAQYCDDVQDEMRILNEKLKNREKKYQRLKSDNKNLVEKRAGVITAQNNTRKKLHGLPVQNYKISPERT